MMAMMKYQSLFSRHGIITEVATDKSGIFFLNEFLSSHVNKKGIPIQASMKE